MIGICFMSGMSCNADCPLYHEATQQCKIAMALNRYLGDIDGQVAPKEPIQTPVVEATKPDNPFPELAPGSYLQSIAGRIATPIEINEVQAQGKPTPIAKFTITDGAMVVPVAVWEPGNSLNGFNVGSWITLTAMSVKEYQSEIQISTTRKTKISR